MSLFAANGVDDDSNNTIATDSEKKAYIMAEVATKTRLDSWPLKNAPKFWGQTNTYLV